METENAILRDIHKEFKKNTYFKKMNIYVDENKLNIQPIDRQEEKNYITIEDGNAVFRVATDFDFYGDENEFSITLADPEYIEKIVGHVVDRFKDYIVYQMDEIKQAKKDIEEWK